MATKATAPAQTVADEEKVTETAETVDPRAAALAALTGGNPDPDAPAAEPEPELVPADAEDFGGDLLAVVLTTRYNAHVDGKFRQAKQGALLRVTAAALDRGVDIGALRAVDGK